MARFVRVQLNGASARVMFVNFDRVEFIEPTATGSRIVFRMRSVFNKPDDCLFVTESCDALIAAVGLLDREAAP